jgi:hypothetical protein
VTFWISEAKDSPKIKKLRMPINRKCNDTVSANLIIKYLNINLQNIKINKIITVETLFKNQKQTQNIHIYSSAKNSEVVLVFQRNNAGFKKPSSFV